MRFKQKIFLYVLCALVATVAGLWLRSTERLPRPVAPSAPRQTPLPSATPPPVQQVVASASRSIAPGLTNRVTSVQIAAAQAGKTRPATAPGDTGQLSDSALQQIAALEAEKRARTPAQQKIDCHLLDAGRMRRGLPIAEGIASQRLDLDRDGQGRVLVDISARFDAQLLRQIEAAGGQVLSSFAQAHSLRAALALDQLEPLAERPEVQFIAPAVRRQTSRADSEGDVTHQAKTARQLFSVTGAGVKVGVISDSIDFLSGSQVDGRVTVLPGQSGVPATGEGTAMLEIINDLAPGAQLFFASADGSEASFADNIRSLRFTYGCDIIVDDVIYLDESPFQDGIVAQAVNAVTADGALYFSAAGNSGSQDLGTSGTWEGDFVDGGQAPGMLEAGRIHSFGAANYNTVVPGGDELRVDLFWADPLGASTNDYDLYVLDSTGTRVVAHSSNTQRGASDPYEHVPSVEEGERLVVVKFSGAGRFLHLCAGRGQLAFGTAGSTRGHACADAAFDVAATDATTSYPNAFTGGTKNPVESFSSDGPRRVFFQADGTPITPGNLSASGGAVRQKPDLTAADGISTDLPWFTPFYGTSAAAPHAAAIAALLKSYNSALTPDQVRQLLTSTALDIMGAGPDQDSGAGIVMAPAALQACPIPARPNLTRATDSLDNASPHAGDSVMASVTITNQPCAAGAAPAGRFHVGFYFSTDASFNGVAPFYEAALSGCAANGSLTFLQALPIDLATVPGQYYLGYKIDDQNEVAECDKTDNGIFSWPVTVQPPLPPPPLPASLAAGTLVLTIAQGTAPYLPNSGYSLFFPAASGNGFQTLDINAGVGGYYLASSIGTYAYAAQGANGMLQFVKGGASYNGVLAETRTNSGNYAYTNTSSGRSLQYQTGHFEVFTGQAPSSIAGQTFWCTIDNGQAPYAGSGSFDFSALPAANKYALFTLTASGTDSSGTYSYSKLSTATGELQLTDSLRHSSLIFLSFATPQSGGFVAVQPSTGGFQAGHFVLASTSAPTITATGEGTLSPSLLGSALTPGQSYSVSAKPAAGYLFAGWTGDLSTNSPTLKFVMKPGLSLVAHFIPNPFLTVAGTYNGLFGDDINGISPANAGAFTLTVTSQGTCSGSLQLGPARYPLKGQFDLTGYFSADLSTKGPSLRVGLQLDLTQGTQRVSGSVRGTNWTAHLAGDRAPFSAQSNPAPQAGKYTLIFSGGNDPLSEPVGSGWGTVSVDASGKLKFAGALADGTTVSQAVTLSKDGLWPFYLPLSHGQGLLWGWLTLTNAPSAGLSGELNWSQPAVATEKFYPSGFALMTQVTGSRYQPPAAGGSVLALTNCLAVLDGGGLAQAFTNSFIVGANGRLSSTNKASLTFIPATGAFKGTMPNLEAAGAKPLPFSGVVLQDQACGAGWFQGTNGCGAFYLGQ